MPLGLERCTALDQQLHHRLAAMRGRDVERRFAGNPVGLDARHTGIKAEIQHQPHRCRVARAREIGEYAGVLGLHTSHDRWVRRCELTRLGFIRPRTSSEKRIIAFKRDHDAAFSNRSRTSARP